MAKIPIPEKSLKAYLGIMGKIYALAIEGGVDDRMWPLITALADITHQIPEATVQLEEMRIKAEASKRATDARYGNRRVLLEKARGVAQQLWENGDTRLHHEMKRYLIEEYCDETGKYPFVNLPDKSLLDAVKNVAKDLGKPDLISGRKKSV